MMYIGFERNGTNRSEVTIIYHDVENASDEIKSSCVLVESIPTAEYVEGKYTVLYINPSTNELWYEYFDEPLTVEQQLQVKVSQLEQENAQITYALMMGGLI